MTTNLTTWRDQLDERQRKAVAFAELYVRNFHHGAIGHNDYILIARLAELLDVAAGLKQPPQPPAPAELVLTFGKHRDQRLGEVLQRDREYVEWLARLARDEPIRVAAQALLMPSGARAQPARDEELPF